MTLVGYWPLNETSGSTAYDHSGRENHGTVYGAGPVDTGTVSAPVGGSGFKFDGSDDRAKVTNDWNWFGSGESYSMWVKVDFTDRRDLVGDDDRGWSWHRIYPSNQEYETIDGKGNVLTVTNIGLKTSEWIHFAAVYHDSGTYKIYVNGELTATADASSYGNFGCIDTIGYANNSGYFKGSMAEYRVFNRALTPHEIQYLYQTGNRGRVVSGKKRS